MTAIEATDALEGAAENHENNNYHEEARACRKIADLIYNHYSAAESEVGPLVEKIVAAAVNEWY